MFYSEQYLQDLKDGLSSVPNIETIAKKSIFITGSTGLIGSAIADLLMVANDELQLSNSIYAGAREEESVTQRFEDRLARDDLCYFHYDTKDLIEGSKTFDYIIHAASPASPNLYALYPVETMKDIFEGTLNVLQYARDNSCRVCLVSTSEVYGNKETNEAYKENDYCFVDILSSRACYPSSKRAAETLLASFVEEYGISAVVARPGHIYGPTFRTEDKRASSTFFMDVIEGNNIIMKSSGNQKRSYCYVVDAASAILTILLCGENGQSYNISNPTSEVTIKQLATEIAEQSGTKIVFAEPTEKEAKGYNPMKNSCLNGEKLRKLGWKPLFNIEDGVKHTLLTLKTEDACK